MIATLRKRFESPAVEARASAQPAAVSIPEDGNTLLSGDVAQILREKGVNFTSLDKSDEEEDGVWVEGTEVDLPVNITGSMRRRRA